MMPKLNDEAIRDYCDRIVERLNKSDLNGWEIGFLEDVKLKIESKQQLTDKQEQHLLKLLPSKDNR
ncbi:hypothetical protein [Ancylobacter sp. SL191]|uniref:hypothetical protein n=1 Tax=Ancylobacter sp. SL191 TaxID=2995166 RepID=UPI0022718119|nr:hypothetical protein [Ancylobacter sp. SL191]WAC27278.1 hypothetical protein OU996_20145 [Ancylobacter sp. SL191]